ncbi:MAG TPA: hypothetical protein VKJ01_16375, partial [Candidatus Solibacter sp.]|nr:hypothetical protein [Candidatus Solibacter sp.]
IVSESGVRTDENVVFHSQAIPKLHAALDGYAVADDHVVLDECVVADIAIAADFRAWKHVREGPDTSTFADTSGFDDRGSVLEKCHGNIFQIEFSIFPFPHRQRLPGRLAGSR